MSISSGYNMYYVLLLYIILLDVTSNVEFDCNSARQCLSTSVQYQCTVTDSTTLSWRIRDENMTSLGTVGYISTIDLVTTPAPFTNSLPFFTDYTSKSPSLISNISFTVQSSINGYTIHCEDINGIMENCMIDIPGKVNSSSVTHANIQFMKFDNQKFPFEYKILAITVYSCVFQYSQFVDTAFTLVPCLSFITSFTHDKI